MATRSGVITEILEQADYSSNTGVVGSTMMVEFVNDAYREGWDLLTEACEDYRTSTATFTVASGASTASITGAPISAARFTKLRRLEKLYSGTYYEMRPFSMHEKNAGKPPLLGEASYRMLGETLYLEPSTDAGGTYRIWYVDYPADLSGDSSTLEDVDGLVKRFVVARCVCRLKEKTEEDASLSMARLEDVRARINSIKLNRDSANPRRIADMRGSLGAARFATISGYPPWS